MISVATTSNTTGGRGTISIGRLNPKANRTPCKPINILTALPESERVVKEGDVTKKIGLAMLLRRLRNFVDTT